MSFPEYLVTLSPQELVDRATTDMLTRPDWEINLYICEQLNMQPQLVKVYFNEIEKKIKEKDRKVAIFALTLLETLVKNCFCVQDLIVSRPFLNGCLLKVIEDNKTDFSVKNKCLELIESWATVFGNKGYGFNTFKDVYNSLRQQGHKFPPAAPLFEPPVLKYSPTVPDYPIPPESPVSFGRSQVVATSQSRGSLGVDVPGIKNHIDLLSEVLHAVDPQREDVTRNDLIQELLPQTRAFCERIIQIIEGGSYTDQELEQLLKLNDDLMQLQKVYENLSQGVRSSQPTQPTNISHPQQQHQLIDVFSDNVGSPPKPSQITPPKSNEKIPIVLPLVKPPPSSKHTVPTLPGPPTRLNAPVKAPSPAPTHTSTPISQPVQTQSAVPNNNNTSNDLFDDFAALALRHKPSTTPQSPQTSSVQRNPFAAPSVSPPSVNSNTKKDDFEAFLLN